MQRPKSAARSDHGNLIAHNQESSQQGPIHTIRGMRSSAHNFQLPDYYGTASNLGFGHREQPSPPRAKDIHVFVSSVGDILENKYVEAQEPSPIKPRHTSAREQKWANLRQTSNNLGFSTVDDGSSSVPLVATMSRRVIPHDTLNHSSQTRDLLMHKFTDTPLPDRPMTSLGRSSSVSSSMQAHTSFSSTRANLGLAETLPSPIDEQLRGNRISKDNTPRDQMASILKEEVAAQAADTPAVKVAGSVGRYSNMEYWQQKSETFKQQHNNVVLISDRPSRRALMPASRNPITWE